MVNKIVGWLVLVPLCGLLIAFALANRHLVVVNLNPFVAPMDNTAPGYGIPLFVVLYIVLLIGVLLGGTASWFAQAPHRRRERHWRREAQHLSQELDALRKSSGEVRKGPMADVDDLLELR
ncbi:lipopolysaccharide assembly protein LapA domain-containing protein [uncultured Devosia sp.]|uniref:lipopolysaccharide assembly protein LapA domain-containing protein n=1 Tax=uncultured Devosia sp. TaxID=211434 RepID=UPI002607032E|nr:lipopolysaccharide assembly protein LapA domain-containing protein [uncultured Devosia sp.]